jgi:hypothetical protein
MLMIVLPVFYVLAHFTDDKQCLRIDPFRPHLCTPYHGCSVERYKLKLKLSVKLPLLLQSLRRERKGMRNLEIASRHM